MTRKKRIQSIWVVVAGAILGALLGNAIGVTISSDNLPFFDALGAVIGTGIGFTLFLWRSARPRDGGIR